MVVACPAGGIISVKLSSSWHANTEPNKPSSSSSSSSSSLVTAESLNSLVYDYHSLHGQNKLQCLNWLTNNDSLLTLLNLQHNVYNENNLQLCSMHVSYRTSLSITFMLVMKVFIIQMVDTYHEKIFRSKYLFGEGSHQFK